MNILQHKFKFIFALVLYATVIIVYLHFPSSREYFYNADEGTYYRQALSVNQQGISAFSSMANAFQKNEHQEQLFPNPLRIGHILMAALALYLHNSIESLSYLSLFFFGLLSISVFVYLGKWFDEKTATMIACLVCVSPLLCGLSARALSDIDACFFHTLTLFTFIHFIRTNSRRNFAFFIIAFTINILVKETGAFFIPFYALLMLYERYHKKNQNISWLQVVGSIVLPLLLSGIIIVLILGIPSIMAIISVIIRNNVSKATIIPYVINYNSGPWYLYIIDYILLSPLTMILFLLFLGYYLLQRQKQVVISITLLYGLYFMVCYHFLPKNVRYAVPLEIVIRISAVLYMLSVLKEIKVARPFLVKRLLCIALFGILISYDHFNYHKFFVEGKIYDPVTYELLRVEKIIPDK